MELVSNNPIVDVSYKQRLGRSALSVTNRELNEDYNRCSAAVQKDDGHQRNNHQQRQGKLYQDQHRNSTDIRNVPSRTRFILGILTTGPGRTMIKVALSPFRSRFASRSIKSPISAAEPGRM